MNAAHGVLHRHTHTHIQANIDYNVRLLALKSNDVKGFYMLEKE